MAKPAPPYTPRMEEKASVFGKFTCTRSITDCGSSKAMTLTDKILSADKMIKVCDKSCFVFMLISRFDLVEDFCPAANGVIQN